MQKSNQAINNLLLQNSEIVPTIFQIKQIFVQKQYIYINPLAT